MGAAQSELVYVPIRPSGALSVAEAVELYDFEIEALRLVHLEGLTTDEAAARMGLSKTTFWRVLESCRAKLAEALSSGKPIKLVSTNWRPGASIERNV
ncbi:MAG: DUF134 domain-containing protein [Desulfurococcaceae archaeon]